VDAVAVVLPLDHDRVGRGREREGDGPRHRTEVHPHFALVGIIDSLVPIEFRIYQIEGALEGGVVVVHVVQLLPNGLGAEQVPKVLFELARDVAQVLDVGLAADRPPRGSPGRRRTGPG